MIISYRSIDILCKDKEDKWVVVEVKKSATRDVLDQLLGYMAELEEQHHEDDVKGIIMSNTYDADLDKKIRLLKKVELNCVTISSKFFHPRKMKF